MLENGVKQYLEREDSKSRVCANKALECLRYGDGDNFVRYFEKFVMHRFVIADVDTVGETRLLALADISIANVSKITDGDLHAAGVISGCSDSTSGAFKKISLIFTIQDWFGVRFDPDRASDIITLEQLANETARLWRLQSDRAGNTGTASIAAKLSEKGETGRPQNESGRELATLKSMFPLLRQSPELVYLDNAATMQVPECVLKRVNEFYGMDYANVHRGIYDLSERATAAFEKARVTVAHFIGAKPNEVVFTSGATSSLNIAAQAIGRTLTAGQRIVVTQMEHHSNYLPWLEISRITGADLSIVPVTRSGELDMDTLGSLLRPPTAVLAITHCSNVLGTINPIREICHKARSGGVVTVVDGAQGVRHEGVNVQNVECDFYAFSGHKLMAGSGTGVLWGRSQLLEKLRPTLLGGGTVKDVGDRTFVSEESPAKWEAGTPNIAGAVALAAAIDFIERLGCDRLRIRESELLSRAETGLKAIDGVHVIGSPKRRSGCVSFIVDGLTAQDIASSANLANIAIRAGHHCALPVHHAMGINSSARVSPAFYNTEDEIDKFLDSVRTAAALAPHRS